MDLFAVYQMICEYGEPRRKDIDRGIATNSEKSLSKWQSVHHKSYS
jgi:hypothetical protein